MWVNAFIFLLFALIVFSLFRGMFYLVKDGGKSKRTVNSFTMRVICSATLILFLVVSAWQGWIQPHSLSGIEYDGYQKQDKNPSALEDVKAIDAQ